MGNCANNLQKVSSGRIAQLRILNSLNQTMENEFINIAITFSQQ